MFSEEDKAALKAAYARIQEAEEALAAAIKRRDEAGMVEGRLAARIEEVSSRIAQPLVVPDAERVAKLLAGGEPEIVPADEIDRQEARNRQLGAEKAQLAADREAVAAQQARFAEEVEAAERMVTLARQGLVRRFGDLVELRFREALFAAANTYVPAIYLARFAFGHMNMGVPNLLDYHLGSMARLHLFHPDRSGFVPLVSDRHAVQPDAAADPYAAILEMSGQAPAGSDVA